MNRKLLLPLLLLGACAGGPEVVRYTAEDASYKLALRCADGWEHGLPIVAGDMQLVRNSLADWRRRLDVDAVALGMPVEVQK